MAKQVWMSHVTIFAVVPDATENVEVFLASTELFQRCLEYFTSHQNLDLISLNKCI